MNLFKFRKSFKSLRAGIYYLGGLFDDEKSGTTRLFMEFTDGCREIVVNAEFIDCLTANIKPKYMLPKYTKMSNGSKVVGYSIDKYKLHALTEYTSLVNETGSETIEFSGCDEKSDFININPNDDIFVIVLGTGNNSDDLLFRDETGETATTNLSKALVTSAIDILNGDDRDAVIFIDDDYFKNPNNILPNKYAVKLETLREVTHTKVCLSLDRTIINAVNTAKSVEE